MNLNIAQKSKVQTQRSTYETDIHLRILLSDEAQSTIS